jgi:hypothetical protein
MEWVEYMVEFFNSPATVKDIVLILIGYSLSQVLIEVIKEKLL